MIIIEAETLLGSDYYKSKHNTDWPIVSRDIMYRASIDYVITDLFTIDAKYAAEAFESIRSQSLKFYVGRNIDTLTKIRDYHKRQGRNVICILLDFTQDSVNTFWVNRVHSLDELLNLINWHLSYKLITETIKKAPNDKNRSSLQMD